jgi:hypothetical protein
MKSHLALNKLEMRFRTYFAKKMEIPLEVGDIMVTKSGLKCVITKVEPNHDETGHEYSVSYAKDSPAGKNAWWTLDEFRELLVLSNLRPAKDFQ